MKSDAELRIAAGTVRTTKGSYSEVLLLSSNQSSVFRFIPTPAEKTAFTTTAAEVAVYERIREALCRGLPPGHQSTSEALFRQTFMINALQSSLAKSNPQALAAISQAEVAQSTGIA